MRMSDWSSDVCSSDLRGQDVAFGAHAFDYLGDRGVGRGDAVEAAREQLGAVLIADRQRIAETARDREQSRRALAFAEGLGSDGRAHGDRERRQNGGGAGRDEW